MWWTPWLTAGWRVITGATHMSDTINNSDSQTAGAKGDLWAVFMQNL